MTLPGRKSFARDPARLAGIVGILARYGLADWLADVEFLKGALRSADDRELASVGREARIRLALTELGTTFIKVGQNLSTRADLVGPALALELSALQSDTPADSLEATRRIVEEELDRPLTDAFKHFDERPLASASIAQVHAATLPDGTPVVVKVQHAGIEDKILADLSILSHLAELAEKHSAELSLFEPRATVYELRRTLLRELDFSNEARNLQGFGDNFRDDEAVRFPAVYPECSTRRVLTMERLDGIKISRGDALRAADFDLVALARSGARIFLDMIFRDGFYHADPHPGNLVVLADGVIGVLDCGRVARLDDRAREDVEDLMSAALDGDIDQLVDTITRVGSAPRDLDESALRAEIADFVADYGSQDLRQFDLAGALAGMAAIIRRFHIVLPPSYSMLLNVLVQLEGTARHLEPDFNLAELLKPYQEEAMRRRLGPQRALKRLRRAFVNWDRLLGTLPQDLASLFAQLRRGEVEVHVEHRRLEAVVNRLVYGILTAALLMGGTQLWSSQVPPLMSGVSVGGTVLCGLAFALGSRLLLAIRRSGDL